MDIHYIVDGKSLADYSGMNVILAGTVTENQNQGLVLNTLDDELVSVKFNSFVDTHLKGLVMIMGRCTGQNLILCDNSVCFKTDEVNVEAYNEMVKSLNTMIIKAYQ